MEAPNTRENTAIPTLIFAKECILSCFPLESTANKMAREAKTMLSGKKHSDKKANNAHVADAHNYFYFITISTLNKDLFSNIMKNNNSFIMAEMTNCFEEDMRG